jgi:hypothetical protein
VLPKRTPEAPPTSPPLDQRTFAPDFAADRTDGGVDALDIGPDVEAFAQLICLENARPSLSIALFASWGSGKTFFMERLLERVDELTEVSRHADDNLPRAHQIIKNVVQVRFNAWHYSDANLWASLTAEFFDQLRAGGAGEMSSATYESLVDRVSRHVRSLEADALTKTDEATNAEWQLQNAEDAATAVRVRLRSVNERALAEAAGKALSESFEKNRDALKELGRRVYLDDLADNLETFAKAAREVATVPGKIRLTLRVLTKPSICPSRCRMTPNIGSLKKRESMGSTQPSNFCDRKMQASCRLQSGLSSRMKSAAIHSTIRGLECTITPAFGIPATIRLNPHNSTGHSKIIAAPKSNAAVALPVHLAQAPPITGPSIMAA